MGGGVSKQSSSLYINQNGSSKILTNAYVNIDGSQKNIFTGQKKFWYKRYIVNDYYLCRSQSWYDSDTNDNTSTNDGTPGNGKGLAIYSSCSNPSNSKYFVLSGYKSVDFDVAGENNDVGVDDPIHNDYYYLDDKYDNYFFTRNSSYNTCDVVYQIRAGGSYYLVLYSNGNYLGQDSCVAWHKFYYKFPKSHSSSYTLIGALPYASYTDESTAKCYAPVLDSNNIWKVGYNHYYKICSPLSGFSGCPSIGYVDDVGYQLDYNPSPSFTSAGIGYGIGEHTDSNDSVCAYESDGYYWEYLGYYV